MTDFNGLVAIVTGGASGIGAATADAARPAGGAGRRAGPRHRDAPGRSRRSRCSAT